MCVLKHHFFYGLITMRDSKKAEHRRISLEQQKWKKTAKVTAKKKKRSSDNACFLVSHEKK